MRHPPCAPSARRPLCAALRAALRPSSRSALLTVGLLALEGPALAQSLALSALDGTNGFVLNGIDADDFSGGSVSGAGDVNGDGIDDMLIGANYADPGGRSDGGESYLVFGRTDGFGSELDLSALDGTNGFVLNGADAGDNAGRSVSDAGDVNGDGIGDLVIGANYASPAGKSYLVFGGTDGFAPVIELSALDGSDGFLLNGVDPGAYSGVSVSGAGDIDGDGIDDFLVGAYYATPGDRLFAGESYLVFGRSDGFDPALELSALDGTDGFVLNGIDGANLFSLGDLSGYSVSGAGDVNGDGIDDLLIGAKYADPGGRSNAGESYVVFGRTDGFAAALELSALDGTNGFVLNGAAAGDKSGESVSGAGDINGDGIGDVIIGAPYAAPGERIDAGKTHVLFGRSDGFASAVELSALDGINGFVLNGVDPGDISGTSVSGVGDVNGDGVDDLLVGAPGGNGSAGETYVVFGRKDGFGSVLELSALDGTNGFVLTGIDRDDRSGDAVSGAGDVNGDGLNDLLIGAKRADPGGRTSAGESYLVFGTRSDRVCSAPGVGIPDNDLGGVTDTLATFGSSRIADLDVEILASHTRVADLVFELDHTVGGTAPPVVLIDRPGVTAAPGAGCIGNDIDAVLDDEAASLVEEECADTTPTIAGTFIPNQLLSAFDGEAIGGTWTLTAIDSAAGQTGTLDGWCLVPWYQPISPCEAVDLPLTRISFDGLETCLGDNSLTARDTRIEATADVAFLSPAVTLGPGFRVEAGAIFSVGLPPP